MTGTFKTAVVYEANSVSQAKVPSAYALTLTDFTQPFFKRYTTKKKQQLFFGTKKTELLEK